MNPTNDERARFEAWAVKDGFNIAVSPQWELAAESTDWHLCYESQPTRVAARGWLACSQSAPAAQGEVPTPFGWAALDKHGCAERVVPRLHYEYGAVEPVVRAGVAHDLVPYLDREYKGLAPHRIVTLYAEPQPSAPGELATQLYDALVATVAAIRAAGVLQHRDYDQLGAKANAAVLAFQLARDTTTNAFPAAAQPSADDAPRDRPTPEMLAEFVRVYSGADWSENRSQLTKRQLARAEKAYAAMMRIAPYAPPADARDAEDARRYRWLRVATLADEQHVHREAHGLRVLLSESALDEAIDRAMGGES